MRRRFLDAARLLVQKLVNADESFENVYRHAFILVDLAVVAREVFQRLAATNNLQVSFG